MPIMNGYAYLLLILGYFATTNVSARTKSSDIYMLGIGITPPMLLDNKFFNGGDNGWWMVDLPIVGVLSNPNGSSIGSPAYIGEAGVRFFRTSQGWLTEISQSLFVGGGFGMNVDFKGDGAKYKKKWFSTGFSTRWSAKKYFV